VAGSTDRAAVFAQEQHAQHDAVPLDRDIGTVTMRISCAEPARPPFTRGLALLHSFAWEDARAQFRAAATADAPCAMAYWGEAMTYYDGLHNPPSDKELAAAKQALAKADQAATQHDPERAYIAASKALFDRYATATRKEHDAAYSQALKSMTDRYPNDVEAKALYALSLLSLARRGVTDGYKLQMEAARMLEPIFKAHSNHPGIAHYLIHAYDDSGERSRGVAAARAYAKIAPGVTHALHMPSHIFAGLGLWDDTIASNKDSFEASDRAVRQLGQPLSRRSYHAVLYWLYALLQQGKESEARALLAEHRPVLERGGEGSLHDLLARYYLDTDRPADAAEMPILTDRPLQKAEALFVRGLGQARTGTLDAADASLREMRGIMAQIKDVDVDVRARILDVQAKQLEATLLLARKQTDAALNLLRETVRIEDAPGVSWAPPDAGTGLPAHEFFGEALLQLGRRADAVREFEAALKKTPGRRRSFEGLARAKASPTALNR
jgi:predicted Zn-dependent protease